MQQATFPALAKDFWYNYARSVGAAQTMGGGLRSAAKERSSCLFLVCQSAQESAAANYKLLALNLPVRVQGGQWTHVAILTHM